MRGAVQRGRDRGGKEWGEKQGGRRKKRKGEAERKCLSHSWWKEMGRWIQATQRSLAHGQSQWTEHLPKNSKGSPVVQWLRIHLAAQGMQVQSLVGELRSHRRRAARPACCGCWARSATARESSAETKTLQDAGKTRGSQTKKGSVFHWEK